MSRIEYRALAELERAPRNPKKHNLPAIMASMTRFGYVLPIVLDEATGRIVAGHGRLDALLILQKKGQPPPARIEVLTDGTWRVPCLLGIAFATEAEAEAYLLADNRLTMMAPWDDDVLVQLLADAKAQSTLLGTGFDDADLQTLLNRARGDTLKALREKWGAAPGAVWLVPSLSTPGVVHRIACGNALNGEHHTRMIGEAQVDAVVTDPPWEMAPAHVADAIEALATRAVILSSSNDQTAALKSRGWRRSFTLVWVHRAPRSMPRKSYPVVYHNPIEFIYRKGSRLGWRRPDRGFGTIITVDGPEYDSDLHGHGKSVGLFEKMLAGFTWPTWADPFLGSGATLLACERQHKRLVGLELDPGKCGVALERCVLAGLSPTRLAP